MEMGDQTSDKTW